VAIAAPEDIDAVAQGAAGVAVARLVHLLGRHLPAVRDGVERDHLPKHRCLAAVVRTTSEVDNLVVVVGESEPADLQL